MGESKIPKLPIKLNVTTLLVAAVVAALAPHGAPVARREDTPRGARRASDRIVTGIKAIDLLAPLERGMLVRVHGPAETGLTVLLAELSARFAALGGHAVWTSGASKRWQGGVLDQMVADLGVLSLIHI